MHSRPENSLVMHVYIQVIHACLALICIHKTNQQALYSTCNSVGLQKLNRRGCIVHIRLFARADTAVDAVQRLFVEQLVQNKPCTWVENLRLCIGDRNEGHTRVCVCNVDLFMYIYKYVYVCVYAYVNV